MKKTHIAIVGVMALILAVSAGTTAANAEGSTTTLREKVKDRVSQIKENAAENRDQRNKLVEEKKEAKKDAKEIRQDAKLKMRQDVFIMRRNIIVRQLQHALENLMNIKARTESRISKAKAEGRNMAEAERLLVTASEKLATAKSQIDALAALVPPAGPAASSTGTSTAEVDLAKPKAFAESANKSIREAREALQAVVVSIAQNMGREAGKTKPGTKATTTATTATSTATSTDTTTGTTTATSTGSATSTQ
jgi:hypothetical protein